MLLTSQQASAEKKEKLKAPGKTKIKITTNQTLTTYNINIRRFTAPFFIIRHKPHPKNWPFTVRNHQKSHKNLIKILTLWTWRKDSINYPIPQLHMTNTWIDWSTCLAINTQQSKLSPVTAQPIRLLTKHQKCKYVCVDIYKLSSRQPHHQKDKQHPITPPSRTNSYYIPPKKIDTKRQASPRYTTQQNKS